MIVSIESGARRSAAIVVLLVGLIPGLPSALAAEPFVEAMRFAADMAKKGSWREARYRWELLAKDYPNHRKILNNLAVASEALGDLDRAREYYERSLELGPLEAVDGNARRSERFWRQVTPEANGSPEVEPVPPDTQKVKGKTMKVTVRLPVPPRIDVSKFENVLVASFLAGESRMFDINRELVRYLRSELRKHLDLEVLPIVPPPAIPEQTLEDLVVNQQFWRYLGREYDADLIVSGAVLYDRKDASGFRDVDVVSASTGQKVRRSQFVEQEKFRHELEIIFMDGRTGELIYRDRLQRSALFRGSQNDPITAFYELAESMAPDVLAIVKTRQVEDVRYIYKR